MVFIDKMPDDRNQGIDSNVVLRHPCETRPLTLKLADNKIVAAVLNCFELLHNTCH